MDDVKHKKTARVQDRSDFEPSEQLYKLGQSVDQMFTINLYTLKNMLPKIVIHNFVYACGNEVA